MITQFLTTGTNMTHDQWALFRDINGITPNDRKTIDVDICDCSCEHEYLVLAKNGGEGYQNDTSAFLYRLLLASDSLVLSLNLNGVEVESNLSATPLGTHYPAGTFTNAPGQEFYVGHQLDWEQVLFDHGVGGYTVVATGTLQGLSFVQTSQVFTLREYTSVLADKTVRIRWFQKGNILSNEFDYTDMDWEQEIRIPGILWNKKPAITLSQSQTQDRTVIQIQDSIENTYTLETRFLPFNLSNILLYDAALGNTIFMTDYAIQNTEFYIELPLFVKEMDAEERSGKKGRLVELTLTDRQQNIIKQDYF